MRPKRLDIDPDNVSLVRFLSNATGGTWTLTETTPGDSIAHQISIRNDSATDHSAKTADLTGTDADGRTQLETINLPAASATVESTKYFLTLTSVVPSASIGADTMDIGFVDETASQTIPLDWRARTPATIHIVVTGTINYDVEGTLENPFTRTIDRYKDNVAPFTFTDQNDLNWVNDGNFAARTATTLDDLAVAGYRAIRIIINSYTDGAELQVFITQPSND